MNTMLQLPPIAVTGPDYDRLSELVDVAGRSMPVAARFLAAELDRAKIVEPSQIAPTTVTMGSRIRFRDEENAITREVTLVYPRDGNLAADRLSVLTPVGAALIGLSEGQSIVYPTLDQRLKTLTVLKVLSQPHSAAAGRA